MRFSIGKRIIIIVALVILIFLSLNLTGFSKEVREFFYNFSSPIQRNFWQAGNKVSNFFESIFNAQNLNKENYELKNKNQELLGKIVLLQELKDENKTLRQALEINLQKEFKLVFSEIIGKDIGEDFILINKGSADGISEKMPVITSEKVLVGKISQVYNNFSKVMLISHKDEENSFYVKIQSILNSGQEKDEISIKAKGKGKGGYKLFLEMIPKDREILEGEIVVTDILSGIFPKGLLVGEIRKVEKSDIEPFQTAEVSIFFDIKEIDHLFVLTEY
ncbi:rod shape-determining protein MreC [Candidatus Parcubacteria bacterium]|nr:rod shape-determining protein MreC [Candidatus Parcubacteria bacterium]